MRGQYHSSSTVRRLPHHGFHYHGRGQVQPRGEFVQDKHRGFEGQCACKADPLPLTSGKDRCWARGHGFQFKRSQQTRAVWMNQFNFCRGMRREHHRMLGHTSNSTLAPGHGNAVNVGKQTRDGPQQR